MPCRARPRSAPACCLIAHANSSVSVSASESSSSALSGALESTFAGSHLRFDAERGEFRFAYEQGERRIQVVGEGLGAIWTRHALRRTGFEIDETGTAPTAVEIVDRAEGRQWKWRSADEKGEVSTISDLLEELNAAATPP